MFKSKTPEYRIWINMRSRCLCSTDRAFKWYGGRGIEVCDRWRASFDDFIADMGSRPSPAHSIDRINNDGNYEPSNCRWATAKQQANNQRRGGHHSASKLTAGHALFVLEFQHIFEGAQMARVFGVSKGTVSSIITNNTWRRVAEQFAKTKDIPRIYDLERPPDVLDATSVECMRVVYALGLFDQRTIGRWWGLGQRSVSRILKGRSWASAGGPRSHGRRSLWSDAARARERRP